MTSFLKVLLSCEDGEEHVSKAVHNLIFKPEVLDGEKNSPEKRGKLHPSSSPLFAEMSLTCRLYMIASSLYELRIPLIKRIAIAKFMRQIFESDFPHCYEQLQANFDDDNRFHSGALDGCFVINKSDSGYGLSEGRGTCFRLPTLNWHDFRKGYSILMWIKPIIEDSKCDRTNKDDGICASLYRFRSFARRGKYIDATLSTFETLRDDDGVSVRTSIEIICYDPATHSNSSAILPRMKGNLYFSPGEWQLLAITHSFPYLKNPHVTVSINGNVMASGDLAYPTPNDSLTNKSRGDLMEDCVLLENIVCGSRGVFNSCRVAAINLYQCEVPKSVLACAAERGPNGCWEGNILAPNPSVSPNKNTSKGLPKSPILDYINKVFYAYHPSHIHKRYENDTSDDKTDVLPKTRIVKQFCNNTASLIRQLGETEGVKVNGLIKPRATLKKGASSKKNDGMILHGCIEAVFPSCTTSAERPLDLHGSWKLANGFEACLLPFSLALAPHSSCFEHLSDLQLQSSRYLHSLISQKAEFACALLRLSATCLKMSPSFRDEAIQREMMFVVCNLIRRILIRGREISRSDDKSSFEQEDFSYIEGVSVPDDLAASISDILQACCGSFVSRKAQEVLNGDPGGALSIRRTSDLAEQALHGIGLDLALKNVIFIQTVNLLYSNKFFNTGVRQKFGRFIRMKLTVETYLGMIQLHYSSSSYSSSHEQVIHEFASLLTLLLETSLSDANSVTAAEKDVASCVSVLVENKLGTVPAGVVLTALSSLIIRRRLPSTQEMVVEQRLARNLALVDYHSCVGPVILGRKFGEDNKFEDSDSNLWQSHWRLALISFIWLLQLLKKDEAERLSRSVGKWLLVSAEAGALDGVCLTCSCFENFELSEQNDIGEIFGGQFLHEAEKSRRLRVVFPFVPALVTSLLLMITTNPKSLEKSSSSQIEVKALTKLLASAAAATKSFGFSKESRAEKNLFFGSIISNPANFDWKDGISIMLKIAYKLEELLRSITKISCDSSDEKSWIDLEEESTEGRTSLILSEIKASQDLALDACATILVKASIEEGMDLWQSWSAVINALNGDDSSFVTDSPSIDHSEEPVESFQNEKYQLTKDIFSRLACMVTHQILSGAFPINELNESNNVTLCDVSSGLIPVVNIVAEHHVLPRMKKFHDNEKSTLPCKVMSESQLQLLLLIVSFLKRGRDEMGWCSFDEYRHSLLSASEQDFEADQSANDTSRILLPLLRPALSIALETYVCTITFLPKDEHEVLVKELKLTLTAAIVGLHPLSTARDIGFEAISTLRRIHLITYDENDTFIRNRQQECFQLVAYIANEMRVRLNNDRQIRREFLHSHFPDGGNRSRSSSYSTTDKVAHELVETFILGTEKPLLPIIKPENQEFFKVGGGGDERHSFEGVVGDEQNVALEGILEEVFVGKSNSVEDLTEDEGKLIIVKLKEYLDDYEKDFAMFHEDMRMIYMVEKPVAPQNLLKHTEAIEAFLNKTHASASNGAIEEGSNLSNSPEALQYRRLLRCTAHSDIIASKLMSECLSPVCEARISRSERSLNDCGATGAYSRISTYPLQHMSLFDRSLPKHFFGSDQKEDLNEKEKLEKAVNLSRKSTLTIRDITKINIDGEEEEFTDDSEDDRDFISSRGDSLGPIEWNDTGLEQDTRERSDTASSENNILSPNISLENISLNSSRYESTCCPGDGSLASGGAGKLMARAENVLHLRAEGSRTGTLLLTNTHLIIQYDSELFDGELLSAKEEKYRMMTNNDNSEDGSTNSIDAEDVVKKHQRLVASLRPRSLRWSLAEMSHAYLRRYRLRDSSLELFFIPSAGSGIGVISSITSIFLDFGSGKSGNIKRDDMADAIMRLAPGRCVKQWPDKSNIFMQQAIHLAQNKWINGVISNFDYLLELNTLAGRSFNDLCQYPVFPWVLQKFTGDIIPSLTDPHNFRDLSAPVGALNIQRLSECLERFDSFQDQTIPPFMYGSHYSTSAGVVLHFLVRLHPFAGLHRQLQNGHFDVADRLFSSIARTWEMCTGTSAAEVKELTPEFYCNPDFLRNVNKFRLGTSQEGEVVGDVILPDWAKKSPEKFIEVMRCALESDLCTAMLPKWIDLIFGFKQKGKEAIEANNVFFYLTYYGSIDVASIEDESLRSATELQIAHFGQCPMQLFRKPHPSKKKRCQYTGMYGTMQSSPLQRLYGSYRVVDKDSEQTHEKIRVPFLNAPLCYWVNIPPPPPGPHAHLVSIRFIGQDKCLAVDAKGVYHLFRWAWKADPPSVISSNEYSGDINEDKNEESLKIIQDEGCFIAQRELGNFREIPRLLFCEKAIKTVCISHNLFSNLSLVLADGNGRGALSIQFVDITKGFVKSEALVPRAHADRITAISSVPVTHAFGEGELALVGSADGTGSVWRFITSEFLSLRPKFRLKGHGCEGIIGVALDASLNVCVTVSRNRCCIHSLSNGTLLNTIKPPKNPGVPFVSHTTVFAETSAVTLSKRGFLVVSCQSFPYGEHDIRKPIVTLQLFSLEGIQLGSRALDSWRGIPNKIIDFADGTLAMVSAAGGITVHRLSSLFPLEYVDEWRIFDDPDLEHEVVFDMDLGPSRLHPVVAAAACSSGALRLHALPGISKFSEGIKKNTTVALVGGALAKPAKSIKKAVGNVTGIGNRVVGFGKEIGKEAITDVKDKGLGGFLGGVYDKAKAGIGSKRR